MKKPLRYFLYPLTLVIFACSDPTFEQEKSVHTIDNNYKKISSVPTNKLKDNINPDAIKTATDAAAQWQLAHMTDFESYVPSFLHRTIEPRGWVQGTFYLGLSRWALATGNEKYLNYLREHGNTQNWQLGPRAFHADDHVIAQYYLHIYEEDRIEHQITPTLKIFDHILANKPESSLDFEPMGKYADLDYEHDCQKRWCWSDALFMSPPVWFHLSQLTGDEKYANYAHKEFIDVTNYLFDTNDNLFIRDSRFFDRRENSGVKIYWSRGNGWVFAGLTKIMDTMSIDDPKFGYYAEIYNKMAHSLADKQASSGYWPVSLAAGEIYTASESSGTAFFIAGLAWGINQGLLDRDKFLPIVDKGWTALLKAQRADGMLGYVQQIGYAPDDVSPDQTQLYGMGAFLLAGTQMYKLSLTQ